MTRVPGTPVQVVRSGVVIVRGYFYAQTSPTQVAIRSRADTSMIGLFALEDVVEE